MTKPKPSVPPRFERPIQSAPQQITTAIKESILDGTLAPGERLPSEEKLAEIFGVSRPTLREALRGLKATNILISERGRGGGYRVSEFSPRALAKTLSEFISLSLGAQTLSAAQLVEVREGLEVLTVESAARNRTDEDIQRLSAIVPSSPPKDSDELLRVDLAFHHALADATHNPLIIACISASTIALQQYAGDLEAGLSEHVLDHLDQILAAVVAQDVPGARAAMSAHLRYFSDFYSGGAYDHKPEA